MSNRSFINSSSSGIGTLVHIQFFLGYSQRHFSCRLGGLPSSGSAHCSSIPQCSNFDSSNGGHKKLLYRRTTLLEAGITYVLHAQSSSLSCSGQWQISCNLGGVPARCMPYFFNTFKSYVLLGGRAPSIFMPYKAL